MKSPETTLAKVAPFKREAEKPASEIALAFDDNRLASLVFGQYDSEPRRARAAARRLDPRQRQSGGVPRPARSLRAGAARAADALCRARSLGSRRRRATSRARSRNRAYQKTLFPAEVERAARCVRRIAHPPARRRARPQRGAGRLPARAAPARTGVRRRPGRHRQDLARRRPRRLAAGAGRGRAADPVAPGGRGRRAARLPARRHEGQGRSLPAADLRRALRFHGRRAWSSAGCRPA